MNERRLDFERLQRFTREGEQSAFADVVRRHLDLVFGTAMRKVEDPGAAQEVSQNVFAALGRKAWQFGPDDSLPAWLHKTALFESNTWLRGELRRRRREEAAAELGTTMNTPEEQPALAELVPLLDEALLSLRERDRTALLLRFHENQSLREVGAAFGITEDTARKRVQSALEKLTEFFQRRGFKTASVAAVAAALEHSATTASAAVATSLVGAAQETVPPVLAGFKALLARLVVLTRSQRAALGGALAIALLLLCLFLARSLEAANRPSLAIERAGTNVMIRFTGALQRAEQAQGPFRPVPNNGSPLVVPAGAGPEFWRAWLPGIQTVAAGLDYTVAVRADGTLWAWGRNDAGQLGMGTFTTNKPYCTDTPQRIGSDTNWQAIAARNGTVALRADGTLWEWGGAGNTPQRIGTNSDWRAIAAGGWHTVALRADGTLWAWGRNDNGQLGDGTYTTTSTPQQIGNDTNWHSIAAGVDHSVALRTDGTLWAWGLGNAGQLGNGTNTSANTPQQIGTNDNWLTTTAGAHFNIGLRTDGTLWTWGYGDNGALGTGTNTIARSPQRVGNDTNWQAVAAGTWHSVALRTDGTLWAWGANNYTQLGNGTSTSANTPQRIGTATNWQAIATGDFHTLALRVDGTLWSWGKNDYGQLGMGNGTTCTNWPYFNLCPWRIGTPQQVGTNTNWGPPP